MNMIKPLGDRVIIKPAPPESKTKSGIIIPDTSQEKSQRGTVVAVGPGRPGEPTALKEGDEVIYSKYAGSEIKIEGEDHIIMREYPDVWATL